MRHMQTQSALLPDHPTFMLFAQIIEQLTDWRGYHLLTPSVPSLPSLPNPLSQQHRPEGPEATTV